MKPIQGPFSQTLLSLELQLKTILEEAGGDRVAQLLDILCALNRREQEVVLDLFKRAASKLLEADVRLSSQEDVELRRFEEGLYAELEHAMQQAAINQDGSGRKRLNVVEGGKKKGLIKKVRSEVVSLEELRTSRKTRSKPVLN